MSNKQTENRSPRKSKNVTKNNNRISFSSLLFLTGIVALTIVLGLFAKGLTSSLRALGYLGAFLISLIGSSTVILPLPTWTVILGMATQLDPIILGVVTGLGSAIGESTGYFAGLSGRRIVYKDKDGIITRHKRMLHTYGPLAIVFVAFVPNPVFDLAGIAAGAVKMPYWKFFIACFIGKTLRFILLMYTTAHVYSWLID